MSNIEETPLARQGWNVAERMLAPRLVHFTDRQLVWECASVCQFEVANIIKDQDTGSRINGYEEISAICGECTMSDTSLDYLAGIWSNHVISGLTWGRLFRY
jgi:hypothetical protein